MKKLEGRIAVVTGAASGIGRGVAVAFAREGADILVADMVGADDAATVLTEIAEAGTRGVFVRTDVSDEASVRAMAVHAIEEFGRVDILVNNAGIFTESLLEDMAVEDWIGLSIPTCAARSSARGC
jgi:3-oxoacyl-[acyl-carrier protein] reductase